MRVIRRKTSNLSELIQVALGKVILSEHRRLIVGCAVSDDAVGRIRKGLANDMLQLGRNIPPGLHIKLGHMLILSDQNETRELLDRL